MAAIRIKFRAFSSIEKEGALFYRVTHNRRVRQVASGYKVFSQEWDAEEECLVLPAEVDPARRDYLASLEETLLKDIERLKSIIARLDRTGEVYTADKVVEFFLHPVMGVWFHSFCSSGN